MEYHKKNRKSTEIQNTCVNIQIRPILQNRFISLLNLGTYVIQLQKKNVQFDTSTKLACIEQFGIEF